MTKDPICGMNIDEKKAAKLKYKGKTYYFCSPACQWAFEENPKQFLDGKAKEKDCVLSDDTT